MKTIYTIICLLILIVSQQVVYAQQPLAQQAFTIFEQHCLDCHGEFGSYSDVLTMKHKDLIEDRSVIPGQPDASELYLRLLGDTDTGLQMPLGQEPLDSEAIATIRRWIEAGAPDWEAIPKPKRRFITTEAMLKSIHTHVSSLTAFDRSFARYFTLTHLYNAGASDDNLRAYRNALSKLVNSLSWGAEVIKPTPIDQEQTIFYIDLRHYEWDIKSDKWYKIEQAYPYGVQLTSSTYTTLCQETNCELPFVRADWFIATASLPPLYHEILDLPKTDKELETRLEVDVAGNLKNAPGVRVWRAGFNESGVSVNNRIVERHKSRYGAYWKSYDFAGNVGTQNIFTHPLNFTHDGGEIIFNLPNGLQAYYLTTAKGDRLDEAPINIVSNAGARDPVVRNGLSCMGCHTEGMKAFEDQVRLVIKQNRNPSYDKAQALRLYAEKSEIESLVRQDIARYRKAIEAAGGIFGGSEPIQQLVKQFEGPLDATHAAAEVGLKTNDFLQKIRENSALQNAGLLVLAVEKGTVKRDAWESQFGTIVSGLTLDKQSSLSPSQTVRIPEKKPDEGFVKLEMPLGEALTKITFILTDSSGDSNDAVVFDGEGLTHHSGYINLRRLEGDRYSYYTLLTQHTVEGSRYIFVPLASSGGGSGVFWDLNVVDKKILKSVDDIGLGDRSDIKDVILVNADSDTVSITYIEREVIGNSNDGFKVVYDPDKAIKKHFRMIQGTLQEIENPLNPSGAGRVLIPDHEIEDSGNAQILLSPSDPNMVLIPAGEFQMESNDQAFDDENWIHTVYVDAFYIDIYEVTNAEYKMFVDANPQWQKDRIREKYHDGNYLKDWSRNNYPIGKDNHPVANVSWYGAMAYAGWVGKRLPTQAEWEKAARGGLTGQRYPWGNSIDFSNANHARNVNGTTPVGSYPPNRYGLYDVVGNVWEWCLDKHDRDFYKVSLGRNPIAGSDSATDIINEFLNLNSPRVIRGGSWIRFARDIKISSIDYGFPDFSNDDFGFRCVKDVTPNLGKHGELSPPYTPDVQKEQKRVSNKVSVPQSHTVSDDMVLIPAGEFRMGSNDNDAEDDENPMHIVYVDAFYIDKYEVTNTQYKKFIDANPQWQKDRIPRKYHDGDYLKHWNGNNYPPGKGNHPIVYVSWYAAIAYAQWHGKRLPIEAEWEKAARGGLVDKKYTWGDSLDTNKANYGENIGGTTAIGTYPANGYDLYDMTGNVWEWCLDEYNADFYFVAPRHNPIAGGTVDNIVSDFTNVKSVRVLRGGSWVSNAKFVRVSDRTRYTPKITNKARGFRCVRSITQTR